MSTIDPTSPVNPARGSAGDNKKTGTKATEASRSMNSQHDAVAISDTAAKLSAAGVAQQLSSSSDAASSVRRILTAFSLQPNEALGAQGNASHEDVHKLL